jgi:hypothetical protein
MTAMGAQYYLLSAVVGAAAVVAIMFVTHPRTIRTYWDRACTGSGRYTVRPDDQILSVYRALYPIKGWPDAIELETLALRVEKTYGVELRSIWRDDLTMGEIFERSLPQHS